MSEENVQRSTSNAQRQKLKLRKWYAGFIGEKQITKWYLSIDKAWKVARAAKCRAIRSRRFIEPQPKAAI